jgi:hypothetical protein
MLVEFENKANVFNTKKETKSGILPRQLSFPESVSNIQKSAIPSQQTIPEEVVSKRQLSREKL